MVRCIKLNWVALQKGNALMPFAERHGDRRVEQ